MMTRIYVHLDSGDDVVSARANDSSTLGPAPVAPGESVIVAWRAADAFELEPALV